MHGIYIKPGLCSLIFSHHHFYLQRTKFCPQVSQLAETAEFRKLPKPTEWVILLSWCIEPFRAGKSPFGVAQHMEVKDRKNTGDKYHSGS